MKLRRPGGSRIVLIAAGIVCVVGAGAVIVGSRLWQRDPAHRLVQTAAMLSVRPVDARVGGFPHVPFRVGRGTKEQYELQLKADASLVLRNSNVPAVRGKALLMSGYTAAAIGELARASASGDPDAWSDLAAARIAEADELDTVEPALEAVIAARRAIAVAPNHAAAHFNLGLALERVGLTDEAHKELTTAATLERGSRWAAEALERAHTLAPVARSRESWPETERRLKQTNDPSERRSIVASNVGMARRHAEGPYLIEWAKARLKGPGDDARATLKFARAVADEIRELTGERLASDAAAAIARAEGEGEETALALARALILYGDGRVARRDHDDERALPLLARAARELEEHGSPLHSVARYQIAGAYYEQTRIDEALAQLDTLDQDALRARGYHALAAQIGWERGICLLVRGGYSEAWEVFDRAYEIASAMRDNDLAASLDGMTAQALEYLGDTRAAWKRRARALRLNARVGNDWTRALALSTAANSQIAARNWAQARTLLDYALPLASNDPLVSAQVHAQRSVARDEAGDHAGAAADRETALRLARQIAAPQVRGRLQWFLEMAEGVARRDSSPAAAIAHFGAVIMKQRQSGQSSLLPRLYYERARAHAAAGNPAGERDDLRAGLKVVEAWERSISTPEQRAAVTLWGDIMRRDLIRAELAAGDVAAAFGHADRRPMSVYARPARPVNALREVQSALSPDAAIIEFVRTRNQVIAFVIRTDRAVATTLPTAADRVAAVADTVRNAADVRAHAAAAELYEQTLQPVRRLLEGVRTIAFVPDHDLNGLSMGALYDSKRGRYVIEDFLVVHAPSAIVVIEASRRAGERTKQNLLAIAASEFDTQRYPALEKLPNVKREIEHVAAIWRDARVLAGEDAVASEIERYLHHAAIAHYAGHITGRGADSRLVVNGSQTMTSRSIARMNLSEMRVVVLSACRGADGGDRHPIYSDVASAFLAAGVPAVIASANDVDDAEAPRTVVQLHRFLRDGDEPAAALRNTILLERFDQQRPLPMSLGFLLIGGTQSLVR